MDIHQPLKSHIERLAAKSANPADRIERMLAFITERQTEQQLIAGIKIRRQLPRPRELEPKHRVTRSVFVEATGRVEQEGHHEIQLQGITDTISDAISAGINAALAEFGHRNRIGPVHSAQAKPPLAQRLGAVH